VNGELLFWLNLLVGAGVYALLALSLNLINGYARMFHLGHHGFWALGAYTAALLSRALEHDLPGPLLLFLTLLASMVVGALGGVCVGVPCLRLRGDYLAVATLGFGELVWRGIANVEAQALSVPRLLMEVDADTKVLFRAINLALVLGCCALAFAGIRRLVHSAHGRRLLAVAQDETAAELCGIEPARSKRIAFAFGASLAALAGALYAHYQGSVAPEDFKFIEMVKMLLIVVLGGIGSQTGCVVGALLFVGLERLLPRTGEVLYSWWQVEFPLLLALVMLFRPRGLLGRRELGDVVRSFRARRARA